MCFADALSRPSRVGHTVLKNPCKISPAMFQGTLDSTERRSVSAPFRAIQCGVGLINTLITP